jgi:hypothetical protein
METPPNTDRDLSAEYLQTAKQKLEDYRANKVQIDNGDDVEGSGAGLHLSNVAKEGATYADIGSSAEEIEALFGKDLRDSFDKNNG